MRVIPSHEVLESMVLANSAAEPSVGETAFSLATYFNDGDRTVIGAPSSTVTISQASPAVVTWANHGLADGTTVFLTTSSALPTGLTAGMRYYVVRSTSGSFQLSTTQDGLPVATTTAGSGTHTATAQVHQLFESLTGTSSVVTLAVASPGSVPWTGHGLDVATPVIFTTTGTLPTGLTAGTTYYVVSPTENAFNVAATVGGSAINFTGSPSGTHTAHANPNIGHPPARDDGTYWALVGASNAWGLYDPDTNVGTEVASPFVFTHKPGFRFDAFALTGLVADAVEFSIETVADGVIRTEGLDLSTRVVVDWYGYTVNPFTFMTIAQWFDLPPASGAEITVTVTRAGGPVYVSNLWLNQHIYLGKTQHKAKNSAVNFSEFTRDQYGKARFNRIRSIPKASMTISTPKTIVPAVLAARDLMDARPGFWSGIDDQGSGYFPALSLAGAYRNFEVDADQPEDAITTLDLEGI